ncbi:MAG: hypothetical protein AABW58_02930 [Nanoarchaeota archaeon]
MAATKEAKEKTTYLKKFNYLKRAFSKDFEEEIKYLFESIYVNLVDKEFYKLITKEKLENGYRTRPIIDKTISDLRKFAKKELKEISRLKVEIEGELTKYTVGDDEIALTKIKEKLLPTIALKLRELLAKIYDDLNNILGPNCRDELMSIIFNSKINQATIDLEETYKKLA